MQNEANSNKACRKCNEPVSNNHKFCKSCIRVRIRWICGLLIFIFFIIAMPIGIAINDSIQQEKEQKFKENYPAPKIEVLSGKEPQGKADKYTLKLKINDGENLKIKITANINMLNEKVSQTIEQELTSKDDIFERQFQLLLKDSSVDLYISIDVKNKYKSVSDYLIIRRDKSDKELAYDEELKTAKAKEKLEYERSPTGKLCKKHPDWTQHDCERVIKKEYWIGMSVEMIKAEIGSPTSINNSNYGEGEQYQWCWYNRNPSCFYGGADGIVTSYN